MPVLAGLDRAICFVAKKAPASRWAALAATCAAFRVSIHHDFVGRRHVYEVTRPLRAVYLESSEGHMRHVRNADVDASAAGA